jgi:uncharacterized protein YndB with AHSA1/START domain
MPQLLRVSRQRLIVAPIERVWSIVADFGHENQWVHNIRRSSRDTPDVRVGTVRTLELEKALMGRDHVEEVIMALEPMQLLAYRLRGSAGPFTSAESHWRFREEGRGTIVEVEGRFMPRNAVLGFLVRGAATVAVRRALDGSLRELAAQVEGAEGVEGSEGVEGVKN